MDIKLNVYQDRLCRKLDRTIVAQEFSLSTAICEEVIGIINPDSLTGLNALSKESQIELLVDMVKDGYPYFMELIKEIFELNDDSGYYKPEDIGAVIVQIYHFAMGQLGKAIGKLTRKN